MIAFIEGTVTEVREESIVVRAGSFGVELLAPRATLVVCTVGETVRLSTHLAVKEDSLTLFGFHEPDLLEMFRYLISVGGIGPKLGLAILSTLPPAVLAGAILGGDAGLLSSTPGVGKRTAERLILELKDKLPEHLLAESGGGRALGATVAGSGADAVEALLALGYRESQVKTAIAELVTANPDDTPEALIRKALAKLR